MNEQARQTETGSSSFAPVWIGVVLLLAGVAGYYVLGSQPGWLRWLSVVGGFIAGALVFGVSPIGHDFRQFVVDARNELRKVFWPTRNEAWQTTLVVFIFAVVVGLFFYGLDTLLTWLTKLVTGQGS